MVSISNRQCDLVTFERDNYKGNKILETSKEVLGRRRKRRGKQLTESLGVKSSYQKETDHKNKIVSVQNPLHSTNQSQRYHQITITEMVNNCSTTSITNNYNSYDKCKKK